MVCAGVSCVFDETIVLYFLLIYHVAKSARRPTESRVEFPVDLADLDLRMRPLEVLRPTDGPIEIQGRHETRLNYLLIDWLLRRSDQVACEGFVTDLKLRAERVIKPDGRDRLWLVSWLFGSESANGAQFLKVRIYVVVFNDVGAVLVVEVAVA